MNDKELTKLAAKAFGVAAKGFSPLTDDGDALRLAVKLELDIVHLSTFVQAGVDCDGTSSELYNGDPYAATRRAIVRAAAEIGKAMSLE